MTAHLSNAAYAAFKAQRQDAAIPRVNARVTRLENEALFQQATIAITAALVAAEWEVLRARVASNGQVQSELATKNMTTAIHRRTLRMLARTGAELADILVETLGDREEPELADKENE